MQRIAVLCLISMNMTSHLKFTVLQLDVYKRQEKFIILRAFCKRAEMGIRNSILYRFVLIIHSLYMLNTLIKFFYFFGRNIFSKYGACSRSSMPGRWPWIVSGQPLTAGGIGLAKCAPLSSSTRI